jgi:hypothetical protein
MTLERAINFGLGSCNEALPLHMRGVIGAENVSALRENILHVIAQPPHAGRKVSSKSFRFLIEQKANDQRCLETLRALIEVFVRSPMHAMATAILGADYVFMPTYCAVRHQVVDRQDQTLDFHVDAIFLGFDERVLNFWVSLDDAGTEAPCLTFLNDPDRGDRIWRRFVDDQIDPTTRITEANNFAATMRDDGQVDQTDSFFTPRIKAGDALLFDNSTVHATQDMNACTRDRVSIEFRVCARDRVPAKYRERVGLLAIASDTPQGVGLKLARA